MISEGPDNRIRSTVGRTPSRREVVVHDLTLKVHRRTDPGHASRWGQFASSYDLGKTVRRAGDTSADVFF